MNTPTHIIVSLAVLPKQTGWVGASMVIGGAVLPDAAMFGFYAYQKMRGTAERDIWGDHYFREGWQLLFDVFNSFPLFAVLLAVSWWMGWQWGVLLSASAMLHLVGDLPLHNDDAHRHFLPFTNWRFESPVSYWDPRYYGRQFATAEALSALALAVWLVWPGGSSSGVGWPTRVTSGVLLPLFVAQTVAVIWFSLTYCEAVNDKLPSRPRAQPLESGPLESVPLQSAPAGPPPPDPGPPAATASEGATSSSSTP